MGKIYLVFLILVLISAVGTMALAFMSWRRHPTQDARLFAALLFSVSWWGIFNGLEGFMQGLSVKIFLIKCEYIGILFVGPLFLGFVLQYTRRSQWLQRRYVFPSLAVSFIFLVLVWTNPWHRLFDQEFFLTTEYGFLMTTVKHGPIFWVHIGYTYFLLLVSSVLLLTTIQLTSVVHNRQQGMIFLALLVPWGVNVVSLLPHSVMPPVDFTPLAFSITGILLYLAVFRLHLLDITPIARKAVMENIQDGVLVLDHEKRVIDANPIVLRWLGLLLKQMIGKPAANLFPILTEPIAAGRECLVKHEFESVFLGKAQVLEAESSPIFDAQRQLIGWVLLLRDVTDRKVNERALEESLKVNESIITGLRKLEQDLEEAKALLEQAFTQSPVPMILLRYPAGSIEMMNSACKESFRIDDPNQLIGRLFSEVNFAWQICDRDGHALPVERSPFLAALSGETLQNAEFQVQYQDGTTGWGLVNATPVWNKNNQQIAALLVFVDITERKQIEDSEREQRLIAEAYRDTAAALNSTIQMDSVLNLVLTNIERVVPHDAAHLIIFNEAGEISRTRFRGYPVDEQQMALDVCIRATGAPEWLQDGDSTQAVMIADVSREPMTAGHLVFKRLRSFLYVPIWYKEGILGVLSLSSMTPNFFTKVHAARLRVFADQAAIAIENSRLYAEMQYLTLTDELTRVFNYRGLIELGEREFERARRFNRPLTLLFLDVDNFRDFNNQYSHAVGNQVLQSLAKTVRGCLRGVDIMARFGGEEFVVILAETNLESALEVAERVRHVVSNSFVQTRYGRLNITISIGVVELDAEMHSLSALIDKANQAEQRAKKDGRNQVSSIPLSGLV